jgi:hypothetical protein
MLLAEDLFDARDRLLDRLVGADALGDDAWTALLSGDIIN